MRREIQRVTTKQLLAAAGLRGAATMQRWIRKGILLPGRSPEALARCEWFCKQREQGLSESDMRKALSATTPKTRPTPPPARPQRRAKAPAREVVEPPTRPHRRGKAAPETNEVTTAQILEAAGLSSRSALYKWIDRGILLGPVGKRGAGPKRGVHLLWSEEALRQAEWFRAMRQRGHRVRQLEKILSLEANGP